MAISHFIRRLRALKFRFKVAGGIAAAVVAVVAAAALTHGGADGEPAAAQPVDPLIAAQLQVDQARSAAPTPSVSPSPTSTRRAGPVNLVSMTCAVGDKIVNGIFIPPHADTDGYPDFSAAWKAGKFSDCNTDRGALTPLSDVEKAAYAASGFATQAESESFSVLTDLYLDNVQLLYMACAEQSLESYTSGGVVESEIKTLKGALMLCPKHPNAAAWRSMVRQGPTVEDGDDDTPREGAHAGAYCSPAGARGVTSAGTSMTCKRSAGDDRARWRKS